jgi:hypothetical protein
VQQAISRVTTLDLHPAWTAGELGDKVSALLLSLAAEFGIRGIVPGHIKALVSEGGQYAAFSCTRPGQVAKKTSPGWESLLLQHPSFILNVILVNEMTTAAVEDRVAEFLDQSFGPVHFSSGCQHRPDHNHD